MHDIRSVFNGQLHVSFEPIDTGNDDRNPSCRTIEIIACFPMLNQPLRPRVNQGCVQSFSRLMSACETGRVASHYSRARSRDRKRRNQRRRLGKSIVSITIPKQTKALNGDNSGGNRVDFDRPAGTNFQSCDDRNEEEGRGRLSIVRRPYFETRVRVDVLIIRIRVLLERELTRLQGRGKFEFFIFN